MAIFADPNFWVLISFLGFIAILIYYRVPQLVTDALDKRAENIRRELDEARRIRDEAQKILADYQRRQRDAEREAEDIVAQSRREAESYAAEMRQAMKDTLERRMKLAEDKIARAEEQAILEVRSAAVDKAVAAAETIIREQLPAKSAAKLVESGVSDVRTKLN